MKRLRRLTPWEIAACFAVSHTCIFPSTGAMVLALLSAGAAVWSRHSPKGP